MMRIESRKRFVIEGKIAGRQEYEAVCVVYEEKADLVYVYVGEEADESTPSPTAMTHAEFQAFVDDLVLLREALADEPGFSP